MYVWTKSNQTVLNDRCKYYLNLVSDTLCLFPQRIGKIVRKNDLILFVCLYKIEGPDIDPDQKQLKSASTPVCILIAKKIFKKHSLLEKV